MGFAHEKVAVRFNKILRDYRGEPTALFPPTDRPLTLLLKTCRRTTRIAQSLHGTSNVY